MKRIYLRKNINLVLFVIIIVFGINSCQQQRPIDPFWKINLAWDKNTVTNRLYEDSKNGDVLDCVFTFEKEFYVKNRDVDAKIHASLEYPKFEREDLKGLSYSLVARFKNETIPEFNHSFFNYFKQEMIASYGNITSLHEKGDSIYLSWEKKNNKIEATVIKDINHYLIKIISKN